MDIRKRQVRAWMKREGIEVPSNRPGHVVLSPPGSGKSHFVKHQRGHRWVDEDEFLGAYLKFHTEDWNPRAGSDGRAHYEECDHYLKAMRDEGLDVVGALFWDFVPDAVVLLPLKQHREYVARRSDLAWTEALRVRDFLKDLCAKHKVPVYSDWLALGAVARDFMP